MVVTRYRKRCGKYTFIIQREPVLPRVLPKIQEVQNSKDLLVCSPGLAKAHAAIELKKAHRGLPWFRKVFQDSWRRARSNHPLAGGWSGTGTKNGDRRSFAAVTRLGSAMDFGRGKGQSKELVNVPFAGIGGGQAGSAEGLLGGFDKRFASFGRGQAVDVAWNIGGSGGQNSVADGQNKIVGFGGGQAGGAAGKNGGYGRQKFVASSEVGRLLVRGGHG